MLAADLSRSKGAPPRVATVAALRSAVARWRRAGERIALVPTMGALHAGHLALVAAARARARRVVVSIFVNPTQFNEAEDLATYPRDEAGDLAKLAGARVDLAYTPSVDEMYGEGFATTVTVGGVSEGLCGAHRPGHFAGVATVVTKLFTQCAPDLAVFGEKDYQQLLVVRRLVRDLDLPVEIVAVPTVREADGLALSSRNATLDPDQRRIAPALYATLVETAGAIVAGAEPARACAAAAERLRAAGFTAVDYVELRAAETLAPLSAFRPPARLLAAARIGPVRLIDNVAVPVAEC